MKNHNTWPQKADSLSSYLKIVDKIYRDWCKQDKDKSIWTWFRGHSDTNYRLLPTAYRGKRKAAEEHIRHDFKLKAFPYLRDAYFNPQSDWDFYYLMQHYDAPTRLLDWSEGALIALYFALLKASDKADPAVWMLNPYQLNEVLSDLEDDEVPSTEEPKVQRYLPEPFSEKELPKQPVAFQPRWNSPRMVAQKGMFTIHGRDMKALEDYEELRPHLVKIEIDYYYREVILEEELPYAGISESNLYPELSGLCRELSRWYS